jgi:hypothetical protein
MTSQKQIDANRANARKSTGARTEAGKAITRLNAVRDNITGQITTLSPEDRPIFENLKAEHVADLEPKTVSELKLAHAIAWDTWRLDHLRAVEMNMYALGAGDPATDVDCGDNPELHTAMTGALTFANEARTFALMSLYEQRMNRGIHKNLATLRDLQAERKQNYQRDRKEEVILARYSDISGLTYQAPATPTPNGSVFSNSEIFAAANRLTTLKVAKGAIWQAPLKVQFAGASAGTSADIPTPQTPFSIDFPQKTGPGTSSTILSTAPLSGARPAFLSR